MLPKFIWKETDADERAADELAAALGLPRPVARVLVARGTRTRADADVFLSPDLKAHLAHPYDFPGVRQAAERLWAAIRAGRDIVVFGDFDADGVVASSVLVTALRRLGGSAEVFLPVREPEGYGLTFAALARCLSAGRSRRNAGDRRLRHRRGERGGLPERAGRGGHRHRPPRAGRSCRPRR
jgi:single-stranded-DNA-specific exonuclease